MTKFIAILAAILVAVLSLTAVPTSATEMETTEPQELYELSGVVQEVTFDYILIQTLDGQTIQVNMAEETLTEGPAPEAGDLIHVVYDGKMTRSLPAQVFALRIGCYVREGAIVELTETGFTLDTGDDIIEVHADAALLTGLETGAQVKVYFNGAMTMSIPAQIGAELILAK